MNKRKVRRFKARCTVIGLVILLCLFSACGDGGTEGGGGAGGNGGGGSSPGETYTMAVSHIASETDPIHQGWTYLKEILEERTDGRIQVTVYGNKAISNSNNEDAEKVQQNIVQMTSVPTSSLAALGNIDGYKVFDYPYLFETNEELYTVLDSDLAKEWSETLSERTGVKAYGGYLLGWCRIGTNKGPLNTPEDYKGLKIRTMSTDIQMAFINSLGSSATIVNYGELFTATQQGTVDGMLTSTGLYVSDRFYEVVSHLSCTDAQALLHVPIVNIGWYNSLPDDLREIYDLCMDDYLLQERFFQEEFDREALETLKANGMEIREYTGEEMNAFKEATAVVYEQYPNEAGEGTIEAVKAILGKE